MRSAVASGLLVRVGEGGVGTWRIPGTERPRPRKAKGMEPREKVST